MKRASRPKMWPEGPTGAWCKFRARVSIWHVERKERRARGKSRKRDGQSSGHDGSRRDPTFPLHWRTISWDLPLALPVAAAQRPIREMVERNLALNPKSKRTVVALSTPDRLRLANVSSEPGRYLDVSLHSYGAGFLRIVLSTNRRFIVCFFSSFFSAFHPHRENWNMLITDVRETSDLTLEFVVCWTSRNWAFRCSQNTVLIFRSCWRMIVIEQFF